MKKIIISSLLAIVCLGAFAQDEAVTNKKGVPVLPQAGDIAVGADALPYLEYLGNIFNNSSNNTLNLGSNNLYFRYYLDDNSAIKVNLSISNNTNNYNHYVNDDATTSLDPLSQAVVEDRQTVKSNSSSILIGYMKNRGYGRLLGFYGAQAGYGYSRSKYEYQYGNSITEANQAPTNYWGTGATRTTYIDYGITNTVSAGAFIGVEYYFLPKVCIGGEVSLMYNRSWSTQADYKTESWNGQAVSESETQYLPGNSSSSIVTARPATYSGLYLMFHF